MIRHRISTVGLTLALLITPVVGACSSDDGTDSPSDTADAMADLSSGELLAQGLAAYEAGDLVQAEMLYAELVSREPENTVALFNLGSVLLTQGKSAEALDALDRLLVLDSSNADAYYNRGLAKANLDDTDGAIADYRSAIAVDPQHAEAHFQLGSELIALGAVDEGMDEVDRAIELDPSLSGDDG